LILNCYRLARWYGQNPEVFLQMTVNEVRLHLQRTEQLAVLMQQAATPDGD
jgi:hypothetical protein